jgi:hypothetical protein
MGISNIGSTPMNSGAGGGISESSGSQTKTTSPTNDPLLQYAPPIEKNMGFTSGSDKREPLKSNVKLDLNSGKSMKTTPALSRSGNALTVTPVLDTNVSPKPDSGKQLGSSGGQTKTVSTSGSEGSSTSVLKSNVSPKSDSGKQLGSSGSQTKAVSTSGSAGSSTSVLKSNVSPKSDSGKLVGSSASQTKTTGTSDTQPGGTQGLKSTTKVDSNSGSTAKTNRGGVPTESEIVSFKNQYVPSGADVVFDGLCNAFGTNFAMYFVKEVPEVQNGSLTFLLFIALRTMQLGWTSKSEKGTGGFIFGNTMLLDCENNTPEKYGIAAQKLRDKFVTGALSLELPSGTFIPSYFGGSKEALAGFDYMNKLFGAGLLWDKVNFSSFEMKYRFEKAVPGIIGVKEFYETVSKLQKKYNYIITYDENVSGIKVDLDSNKILINKNYFENQLNSPNARFRELHDKVFEAVNSEYKLEEDN